MCRVAVSPRRACCRRPRCSRYPRHCHSTRPWPSQSHTAQVHITSYHITSHHITSHHPVAHVGLVHRANVQQGETVLITAAAGTRAPFTRYSIVRLPRHTGGVGLAAVDVAKHMLGATVIAAAGGADKLAIARKMGADHCIDYTTQDVRSAVPRRSDRHNVTCAAGSRSRPSPRAGALTWSSSAWVVR